MKKKTQYKLIKKFVKLMITARIYNLYQFINQSNIVISLRIWIQKLNMRHKIQIANFEAEF